MLHALDQEGPEALLARLEGEMLDAARQLEFERAALLRDRIDEVRSTLAVAAKLGVGAATGDLLRHARREPRKTKRRPGR